MKFQIVSEREILDEDYDDYIAELNMRGVPVDGKLLKEKGSIAFTDDLGYTKATTTYKIVTR